MGPPGPGAAARRATATAGSYTRMIRALARGGAYTLFWLGVPLVVSSYSSSSVSSISQPEMKRHRLLARSSDSNTPAAEEALLCVGPPRDPSSRSTTLGSHRESAATKSLSRTPRKYEACDPGFITSCPLGSAPPATGLPRRGRAAGKSTAMRLCGTKGQHP